PAVRNSVTTSFFVLRATAIPLTPRSLEYTIESSTAMEKRSCYSRNMIVMKFGGTSVEDAAAIDRSCRIVAERVSQRPFVVVSALAGATNSLLEAGRLAADRKLDQALSLMD